MTKLEILTERAHFEPFLTSLLAPRLLHSNMARHEQLWAPVRRDCLSPPATLLSLCGRALLTNRLEMPAVINTLFLMTMISATRQRGQMQESLPIGRATISSPTGVWESIDLKLSCRQPVAARRDQIPGGKWGKASWLARHHLEVLRRPPTEASRRRRPPGTSRSLTRCCLRSLGVDVRWNVFALSWYLYPERVSEKKKSGPAEVSSAAVLSHAPHWPRTSSPSSDHVSPCVRTLLETHAAHMLDFHKTQDDDICKTYNVLATSTSFWPLSSSSAGAWPSSARACTA